MTEKAKRLVRDVTTAWDIAGKTGLSLATVLLVYANAALIVTHPWVARYRLVRQDTIDRVVLAPHGRALLASLLNGVAVDSGWPFVPRRVIARARSLGSLEMVHARARISAAQARCAGQRRA